MDDIANGLESSESSSVTSLNAGKCILKSRIVAKETQRGILCKMLELVSRNVNDATAS
jgi:hypothetical protein